MSRGASLAGRRILIVDDDGDGLELIAATLRNAGAEVTAVESAKAALEAVKTLTPDIIITDIAMPRSDGNELQRRLREQEHLAGTPIIALTAVAPSAASANEERFDEYIRKPIDPFELTDRISELLQPM